MQGRVKRKQALAEAAARAAQTSAIGTCALCRRPLGSRIEWHHRVPKSRGGTETVPLHPICHRIIHTHVPNQQLAAAFADLDALRTREDIGRFLHWIADKPADFNAPTKRSRAFRQTEADTRQ